jgi:hypothetical protein
VLLLDHEWLGLLRPKVKMGSELVNANDGGGAIGYISSKACTEMVGQLERRCGTTGRLRC